MAFLVLAALVAVVWAQMSPPNPDDSGNTPTPFETPMDGMSGPPNTLGKEYDSVYGVVSTFIDWEPDSLIRPRAVFLKPYKNIKDLYQVTLGAYTINPIPDLWNETNLYTTLSTSLEVIDDNILYQRSRWCEQINTTCPATGAIQFSTNISIADISFAQTGTLSFKVVSPTDLLMHVKVSLAPYYAKSVRIGLRWLVVGLLALCCIKYVAVAYLRPPVFSWEPVKAGPTPSLTEGNRLASMAGFTQLLSYMQFGVFSSCLAIYYPSTYQPLMSSLSWTTLLFPTHWTTHQQETMDKVHMFLKYGYPGLLPYMRFAQIFSPADLYGSFLVYFTACGAGAVILAYLANFRRAKEIMRPYLLGVFLRYIYLWMGWPLLTFSFAQFYFAARPSSKSQIPYNLPITGTDHQLIHTLYVDDTVPTWALVISSLVIAGYVAGALFVLVAAFRARSKGYLSRSQLLSWGGLYAWMSPVGFYLAVVDMVLLLIRSIAVGCLQMCGMAQVIVLLVVEFISIVTYSEARPFQAQGYAYFVTLFTQVIRVAVMCMCIPFIRSGAQSWRDKLAYAMAAVHVASFLFNMIVVIYCLFAVLIGYCKHGRRRDDETIDLEPMMDMQFKPYHSSYDPIPRAMDRGGHDSELPLAPYSVPFPTHNYYRKPAQVMLHEDRSETLTATDNLYELDPNRNYCFREADLFYRAPHSAALPELDMRMPAQTTQSPQPTGVVARLAGLFSKPEPNSQTFEVVGRRRRPTQQRPDSTPSAPVLPGHEETQGPMQHNNRSTPSANGFDFSF